MFFRTKTSPSGLCLQLLESFRNAQGQPRHRVVLSLGNAAIPEPERPLIAQVVERRLYGQPELLPLEYSPSARFWIDHLLQRIDREGRWHPGSKAEPEANSAATVIDGVRLEEVSHTHSTPLGPSLVGWTAWQRLGLPQKLHALGFNQAQSQAAAVSVINRLVDPGSEHALLEWLPDSSLPELMGLVGTPGGKDRFYRVSDRLLAHQSALEEHLRAQQGRWFHTERTLLLYDLTNSYFEGEALRNPKAQRGKSKEKRSDCPQVVVGMVFDSQGCELAHKVFEGKQSDGQSLVAMIQELEQVAPADQWPLGGSRSLVVVDAGVATRENLALLRARHFRYLVNDSRRGRVRYREEFLKEEGFDLLAGREGRSPVRVRLIEDPDPPTNRSSPAVTPVPASGSAPAPSPPRRTAGEPVAPRSEPLANPAATAPTAGPAAPSVPQPKPDRLILCKSEGRRQKEWAIRSAAETQYLAALTRLAQRLAQGKLKDRDKLQRALGRLQQKHPRVQRFYQVDVAADPLRLTWTRRDEPYQADEQLLGCYVLRTDQTECTADQLWSLYVTLSQAEDGFRALKSDLGLRPNFHQVEPRVEGHIFITVLAYHLLWWVRQTLERAGEHRCWQTIKRLLQTHAYATLILPTKNGSRYRVRKAGEPEEAQKAIYEKLQVDWKHLPWTKTVIENENRMTTTL